MRVSGRARRSKPANCSAPFTGWFTEELETRDLQEAKILLDEVAA
jgi:hypothetical protein